MDLKKLPPSLLVVLGLACARSQPPTVGPCLSPPYDPSTDDPGTTGEPTEPPEPDTGTEPEPEPGDEPPMHPCLSPMPPSQARESLGAYVAERAPAAPHAPAASRDDAIERVLARATLPTDVAERLRRRGE